MVHLVMILTLIRHNDTVIHTWDHHAPVSSSPSISDTVDQCCPHCAGCGRTNTSQLWSVDGVSGSHGVPAPTHCQQFVMFAAQWRELSYHGEQCVIGDWSEWQIIIIMQVLYLCDISQVESSGWWAVSAIFDIIWDWSCLGQLLLSETILTPALSADTLNNIATISSITS